MHTATPSRSSLPLGERAHLAAQTLAASADWLRGEAADMLRIGHVERAAFCLAQAGREARAARRAQAIADQHPHERPARVPFAKGLRSFLARST